MSHVLHSKLSIVVCYVYLKLHSFIHLVMCLVVTLPVYHGFHVEIRGKLQDVVALCFYYVDSREKTIPHQNGVSA